MRVLIVEDDTALGSFLQKGLGLEGHDVSLVGDGSTAVEVALNSQPDLMVLDLGLPQKDGLEVLAELKGRLQGTSVLVLTGRNAIEDRVQALDLGADDCLLKPFSYSELTARCRALLRRRDHFADATVRVGEIELNRMLRQVSRAGRRVELTAKEYALLEYLMLARGRICSRSELLREVWQMSPDAGTNVVDVYVNYLRKKLGSACNGGPGVESTLALCSTLAADRLIETARGEGYSMPLDAAKRSVASAGLLGSVGMEAVALMSRGSAAIWAEGARANA